MCSRPPAREITYGILLPHFGPGTSRTRLTEGVAAAERAGFDIAWVRDHLTFARGECGHSDETFLEATVTLAVAATEASRIALGVAALTPQRHPIHAAAMLASVSSILPSGRVVVGMGLGSRDREFEAVGMGDWDRREAVEEYVHVLRTLWSGEHGSFDGTYYRFDDVEIRPRPGPESIQIWYCGPSVAGLRRAVEYCDGWGPVKMPRTDYKQRVARLDELAAERGRGRMPTAVSALVVPATTNAEARGYVHHEDLLRRFRAVRSSDADRPPDLDGMLIAGSSRELVSDVTAYVEAGADHFVFDLRYRTADWEQCVATLAEEVLPELPREVTEGRDSPSTPRSRDLCDSSDD